MRKSRLFIVVILALCSECSLFICRATNSQQELYFGVQLPTAGQSCEVQSHDPAPIVVVDARGGVYLSDYRGQKSLMDMAVFESVIKKQKKDAGVSWVWIAADSSTKFEALSNVLNVCQSNDLEFVDFVVFPGKVLKTRIGRLRVSLAQANGAVAQTSSNKIRLCLFADKITIDGKPANNSEWTIWLSEHKAVQRSAVVLAVDLNVSYARFVSILDVLTGFPVVDLNCGGFKVATPTNRESDVR